MNPPDISLNNPLCLCGAKAKTGALPRLWHLISMCWPARSPSAKGYGDLSQIDDHVLKDIGAPPWLIAEVQNQRAADLRALHENWHL